MNVLNASLIDWSRAQFAMTAMYHWLFVPLTLGLGLIMAIMESIYVRTGNEQWKKTAKFWMNIFGINFAIGIATGLIMEFQFGTNWSNYSWFVGDIFGAPLAIEATLAFFMEATFISIMFFGWKRVGKKTHLTSTWLTLIGATLSALWILVANAWMQSPVGMHFNPDTTRNEMINFWQVLGSPVAINKFFHTVISAWILGAVFVIGVSAWFILKKKSLESARQSMKVGAIVGLVASVLTLATGDGSAHQVALKQPMKLAAMEGLYNGQKGAGLILFGVPNPAKQVYNDNKKEFLFPPIKAPGVLSFLSFRNFNSFVPGINDIINGGYTQADGQKALSFAEKHDRGVKAIQALANYKQAEKDKNPAAEQQYRKILEDNYSYFGYGYLNNAAELVPSIGLVFWSFHLMVYLGGYFILLFIVILVLMYKKKLENQKWLMYLSLWSILLVYIASQAGWIVAEVGRHPWAIQDVLPVQAAISSLSAGSVITTFFVFLIFFAALLIAEIRILVKKIKAGSELN